MTGLVVAAAIVVVGLVSPPPPAPHARDWPPTSTLAPVASPLPAVPPAPVPAPPPEPSAPYRAVWDAVAECESHGEWDYGPHSTWGSRIYHGGLQIHPRTWDAFRDPDHPRYAYLASPSVQVEVAERILAVQGWGAWPACSRRLGLR